MTAQIEPIIGRYLHLDLDGRDHRVYFEEAGAGIPLLCLHTAGSDARQFRALMTDDDITRHYRVIAFDMPWHGKSSPPAGWEREEYRLSTAGYTAMIMAFARALALDRPVVMGCSIGGRIVLNLALEYPAAFGALIGLQCGAYVERYYDSSWLHRPDVHGGEVCAGVVSGLIAPQSPDEHRWETLWHYMQGGPGVFTGDLHFYQVEGDIRDRIGAIDTALCPLYMLTGEYDYSCSPADTRAAAALIDGAKVVIMPGLAHFPMSENPELFRSYLLPVLEEIRLGL
jgi:pimeloyl-ACP methyl ester carboxylesterase